MIPDIDIWRCVRAHGCVTERNAMRIVVGLITLFLALDANAWADACDDIAPWGLPHGSEADEDNSDALCDTPDNGSTAFFITNYDRDEVAPRWVAYLLTRDRMLKASS